MCKLMFAQNNTYMKWLIMLVMTSSIFAQHSSSLVNATDKWVVSEVPAETLSQSSVVLQATDVEGGIEVYNFNSRRLVARLARTTAFKVVDENKNWVYVTVSGYPVWVHTNYVEREQGQVKVVVQEGRLNLRKEPNKYAMTLGTAENGYSSKELDYKDPWVKIIAPSNLKFAVKKADFNNLEQTNIVVETDDSENAVKTNNHIDRVQTEELPEDFEQESSITTRSNEVATNGWQTIPAEKQTKVQQNSTVPEKIEAKPIVSNPSVANSNNKIPYTDALIYRLTPGDVISIQVYGEPELSINQARIPEGGVISFPLIGQLKVAGKTAVAVENLVTRKLADGYIRNPKVSLVIDNYRPIYIRGAVANSGAFPFTESLTIAKAITLAGGVTKAANLNGVSLIRRNIAVDGQLSIDSQTLVQPGDIISIAEQLGGASGDAIEYIYLHGEVKSPGGYDFRKGLTVEKAVALAGGFSARASKKRINISRQVPGQQEPLKIKKVDLYFPIEPGDVISVGASWF